MSDHTGADGEGQGATPTGSGCRPTDRAAPRPTPAGFHPSRLPYQPISTAPASDGFLAFNRMTGWYVTRREGERFPMHGWDGSPGVWYPEPTFWMPLPPAPCDGSGASRQDAQRLDPKDDSAVDEASSEVEAPSETPTLKAEIERLTAEWDEAHTEATDMMWQRRRAEERAEAAEAALAESERKRVEAEAEAAEAIAQRDILIRANADLAAGWVEDAAPSQETPDAQG